MTLPEELRQAAHYTALDHHRDLLERAAEKIEAEQKDAARYRWLRDRSIWTLISANGITRLAHRLPIGFTPIEQDADEYDAAIDAALSTQGEKT